MNPKSNSESDITHISASTQWQKLKKKKVLVPQLFQMQSFHKTSIPLLIPSCIRAQAHMGVPSTPLLSQVLYVCVCVLLWPANWPPQTSNWILVAVTTTTELSKPYPTYWDETRSEEEEEEESRSEKVKKEERDREQCGHTHTHTHTGKEGGRRGTKREGSQAESESCCFCISVFFMSRQFTGRLFTVWYLALLDHCSQYSLPLTSSTDTLRLFSLFVSRFDFFFSLSSYSITFYSKHAMFFLRLAYKRVAKWGKMFYVSRDSEVLFIFCIDNVICAAVGDLPKLKLPRLYHDYTRRASVFENICFLHKESEVFKDRTANMSGNTLNGHYFWNLDPPVKWHKMGYVTARNDTNGKVFSDLAPV